MKLYQELYKLKNTIRKGWLIRDAKSETGRVESDAEHCFSMALLGIEIMQKENLPIDQQKTMKMILFHELGEAKIGDITPFDGVTKEEKFQQEKLAVEQIAKECDMPEILSLWLEFEEGESAEAKFVNMLDKFDSVMQSKIYSDEAKDGEKIFKEFYNRYFEKFKKFDKYLH